MSPASYDSDFYRFYVPLAHGPDGESVQTLLSSGLDERWNLLPSRDEAKYMGPLTDWNWDYVGAEAARTDLLERATGALVIETERTDFVLSVEQSYDRDDLPASGGLMLSWPSVHFRPEEDNLDDVFDQCTFVFEQFNAPFGFSRFPNQTEFERPVTTADLSDPSLPDVWIVTTLSAGLCEAIGREKLADAPVTLSTSLADDGYGFMATDDVHSYSAADKRRLRESLGIDQ